MSQVETPHVGTLPVTFRPRRVRKVCYALAAVVVVFFTIIGILLTGPMEGGRGVFTTADQVAMVALGVLGALGVLAFARPRVIADAERVRIRNVVGGYDLPWSVVRGVRFTTGNPWVTLELADDEVVAIMAVQAVDKEYAIHAARTLRTLLNQSRSLDAATDSK
ncbi:PH domain-containing protein [Luedemannella helvata]|uniref:PH domain-containing protein n=1 Tax=Luedemannella helvata TaxID=349315 RepID=UPI0031D93CB0